MKSKNDCLMFQSYPYAGLQSNPGETPLCNCGYTFGKFGSATTCNVTCPGNSSEICGGKGVNTVLRSGFKTMVQSKYLNNSSHNVL